MNPVIQFFEQALRLPNGPKAGEPFLLLDWQREALELLYGDSASPVVREAYFSLPKKNAKTSWCAGLVLYHLLKEPREAKAEIYSGAASKEQAELIWQAAEAMVRFSPKLSALVDQGRLEVFRDSMTYKAKDGERFYRALASEAKNNHGINPSFAVLDELHALKGKKGQEQMDVFTESNITRLNPLVVYLTHAGDDLSSIAAEKEKLIERYEQGVIKQPSGFVYRIYRATDDQPWDSEEAFAAANPAYPTLIPRQSYLDSVERARQTPNLRRSYCMYHLNQWVSKSESLVNMDDWKASEEPFTEEDLHGQECYAGFDASTYDDLTAVALVFPDSDGKKFKTLVHAFMPEERLADKEQRDQVPYWEWAEQGYLHLTPGSVIDEDYVLDTVLDIAEKFDLREFAYDPHRARGVVKKLVDAGIPCLEHRTGMISMAEPTAQFTKHVVAHTLRHNGNPLLSWNVSNLQARHDVSGNVAPKKGKHTEKIDAAFALILALGIATQQAKEPQQEYASADALLIL